MKFGLVILNNEIHDKWFDWIENTSINTVGIHPRGGANAVTSLNETVEFVKSEKGKAFLQKLKDKGYEYEYEYHALSWMLKRESEEVPHDWWRTDNFGEKKNDNNMCVSNEDALECIEQRAYELASVLVPTNGKYYMWMDDIENKKCFCEKCKELTTSDQALLVANRMLKGIRRFNPQATLCYLAYKDTLDVPKKIKPDDGIFLEFAPMERSYSAAINDPDCEINRMHVEKMKDLLAFFGTKNSAVLEYWIDNSFYSDFKKPAKKFPFNPEIAKKDIAFYKSQGFEKITSFAGYFDLEYVKMHGEPPVRDYAEIKID